jgi:hypothetical protein
MVGNCSWPTLLGSLANQCDADRIERGEEPFMSDKTRGVYHKFNVTRTDGKSEPGQKHDGCQNFVLDLDHDPHARAALAAYKKSCENEYPALAADICALLYGCAFGGTPTAALGASAETAASRCNHPESARSLTNRCGICDQQIVEETVAVHACKFCGAEGQPGSPDYCSADCAEAALAMCELK